MNVDKDLLSRQQARDLSKIAKEAQLEYKHFNQEQVDKIVKAMADAGYAAAEKLAQLAHEETGFGNVKDKITKNRFGTKSVYESIKDLKSVGVVNVLSDGKILEIAEPMGVVAAIIPSTNPTSTVMFKALISLKCRNALVASPHPKAVRCTAESLRILSEAAEAAGAPKGLMQCMSIPTLEGTEALMGDENVAVVLATGSTPMVRAAYSAGKPAYGVGSGNVPAFIERTANYKKAVADIVSGTTFDNGVLCSSEQAMIVDRPLVEKVRIEAEKLGCYFVSPEEKMKLEKSVASGGRINPEIVGKTASFIANYAGFKVPESTTVLLAHCTRVGSSEPLSMEKLSPILAFYEVDGWLEGCHKCIDLLNYGGIGHTLAIHSNDQEVIMKFALEKPAFRIVVNTPSSLGAVGYTTALSPSMTLGVGTWGGSIISENVTAKHLMNIKTLAFETNSVNAGDSLTSLKSQTNFRASSHSEGGFLAEIEDRLRARAGNPRVYESPKTNYGEAKDKNPPAFGNGITDEEIKKIIKDFKL